MAKMFCYVKLVFIKELLDFSEKFDMNETKMDVCFYTVCRKRGEKEQQNCVFHTLIFSVNRLPKR